MSTKTSPKHPICVTITQTTIHVTITQIDFPNQCNHNTDHYLCNHNTDRFSITDCSIQPVSSCSALSTLALCSVPYTQHIHRPSLVFIRLQLLAAPAVLHQSSALLISAPLTPCPLHDTFHRPLHCPRSASATRHPSHLQDVGGWVPL